jgi:hypothetical protein
LTARIPPEEYEQFGDEVYVSDALIEKYHSAAGLANYQKWSQQMTQQLIFGKSAHFPDDYERWANLGMSES